MPTPDTEWSEQIIDLGVQVNTVQDGDASYREYTFNDAQLEAFTSSRDTYWKEQIEKAVLKGERNRIIEQIREERDTYWRERVEQYNELILAVESKYEGETRHETALRYIKQAEQRAEPACQKSSLEAMCHECRKNMQPGAILYTEEHCPIHHTPTPITNEDNLK